MNDKLPKFCVVDAVFIMSIKKKLNLDAAVS